MGANKIILSIAANIDELSAAYARAVGIIPRTSVLQEKIK